MHIGVLEHKRVRIVVEILLNRCWSILINMASVH